MSIDDTNNVVGTATVQDDGSWRLRVSFVGTAPGAQTALASVQGSDTYLSTDASQAFTCRPGRSSAAHRDVQDNTDANGACTCWTLLKADGSVCQTSAYLILPNRHAAYTYSGGTAFESVGYSSYTETYGHAP